MGHGYIGRIVSALTVLIVACLSPACSPAGPQFPDSRTGTVLAMLDSVIPYRDRYIAAKERRLDSLKMQLAAVNDDSLRYRLYDRIYGEYYSYDLDSAVVYAVRKIEAARAHGDRRRLSVSRLNLARILLAQGKTHEAVAEMVPALPDTVFPVVRAVLYDFMIESETLAGRNPVGWHERLGSVLDSASYEWVYNQSNIHRLRGDFRRAREVLESNMDRLASTPHTEAIASYMIGRVCLLERDTLSAVRHIAAGAVNDIVTPVRDYKSLYELASLLMAMGDVDRAYRYINVAVRDANSTRVFDNILAVNKIMPQIVSAHESQVERERRVHLWYAAGISFLAVCLIVALVMTIRSRNMAGQAAEREKALNGRLREINRELEESNRNITESNRVKDAYLVQYLNLCSYFVGRFDDFRGTVSATARTKGIAGVEKLLAASDNDRELKKFYSNFDSTFLSLFPDFVSQLNLLLADDKQVTLARDGGLTNELRTFALIRLGVSDSEQIAGFLRRSVSTIYNYRVRMRNAAICPRGEFENKVREIKP